MEISFLRNWLERAKRKNKIELEIKRIDKEIFWMMDKFFWTGEINEEKLWELHIIKFELKKKLNEAAL